jgi:hypothetical protein
MPQVKPHAFSSLIFRSRARGDVTHTSDWTGAAVLTHAGWQGQTVWFDRSTGLSEWIELRHGNAVE